jgi:hypothetical protein
MEIKPSCPHCGKGIELVGPSDLKNIFGIGPNALQHARERGVLPEPWLHLNNRNLWLRADIESFDSARARKKVESTVKDLMGALTGLPPVEREEAIKLLREAK